jgi:signal transduction histidine kinase
MSQTRPLDAVRSIRSKLGLLVGFSVVVAAVVAAVGGAASVPWWISLPVTVAAALAVTQWLARGMTSPLREMTAAAAGMAGGEYDQRVTATSADEVGDLARAFNAMAADLGAADTERRRLVATVSHELRTPLAAQRALLENLVDGVAPTDHETLQAALRQSERLSALVADLLDLSRIDAGITPLAVSDVRVAELLEATAAESSLDHRPVRVRYQIDPPDLTVAGDPARLTQLVVNLVDNAIRHSPVDGEVLVSARAVEPDSWQLEVRDEGPGFPADQTGRVFGRFGAGGDSAGGTGLGLAIASWVCELHGGTITALATDQGASGALLRATLPRTVNPTVPTHLPEAEMTATKAPGPEGSGSTASVIPDEQGVPVTSTVAAPVVGPVPLPDRSPAKARSTTPGQLTGRWPERPLPPQPAAVLAALGIGAWAALTWPERSVGLAFALTLLAAGAVMWWVARYRRHPWAITCALLAALLAATPMLRDSAGVVALSVVVAVVVAASGLALARSPLAIPASVLSWPLSALRGLPLLGRTITASGKVAVVWPILRTAGLSLIAVALFGGLFATGDALFGSWADAVIPDLGWDTFVLRIFLLALIAGISLSGAYLALNPPEIADLTVPGGRRVAHAWEWAVPVGLVVVLFAGFIVAQATAMWGGHDYLERTTGLSYAEYVHQGFGQLTVATFLTVVVVALTLRAANRETQRDRILLRALLGSLCLLTLAVVASALYRMSLYQEAFGYTVLRVFIDGFELWLGLVVVMLLIAGIQLQAHWLARAVLVSAAVFALGFAAMNPDAWVAQRNIERAEAGAPLDVVYLSWLSADATPVIVEQAPAKVTACLFGPNDPTLDDDLLAWNLGRSRARTATDDLPPLVEGTIGPCTTVLVDNYRPPARS